jgi:hypothetical protein
MRKYCRVSLFLLALSTLAAFTFAASSAGAAERAHIVPSILGTWTATDGHQINVEASGSDFVGIEVAAYNPPGEPCTHPAGQQVWQIDAQNSDGSYSGELQGFTWTIGGDASTCVVTPYSSMWTVSGPVDGELQLTVEGLSDTFTQPISTTTTTTTTTLVGSAPTAKVSVSPLSLGAKGGKVTLTITVTNADKCYLTTELSTPPSKMKTDWVGSCPNGSFKKVETVPRDLGRRRTITFFIDADGSSTTASTAKTIWQS